MNLTYKQAISIEADALLNDAAALFKKTNVDTILVTDATASPSVCWISRTWNRTK